MSRRTTAHAGPETSSPNEGTFSCSRAWKYEQTPPLRVSRERHRAGTRRKKREHRIGKSGYRVTPPVNLFPPKKTTLESHAFPCRKLRRGPSFCGGSSSTAESPSAFSSCVAPILSPRRRWFPFCVPHCEIPSHGNDFSEDAFLCDRSNFFLSLLSYAERRCNGQRMDFAFANALRETYSAGKNVDIASFEFCPSFLLECPTVVRLSPC